MQVCFFARRRGLRMTCKQPSQALVEDEICDASRAFCQTGYADAADAEEVVEQDTGEDLCMTKIGQSRVEE